MVGLQELRSKLLESAKGTGAGINLSAVFLEERHTVIEIEP